LDAPPRARPTFGEAMRREDEPMAHQQTHARLSSGRFVKGQSGNPAGRSKGSTNHAADLRRLEKDAIKLATNVADTIAETARLVLNEIEQPELIPLFDAITCAAKEAAKRKRGIRMPAA